MWVTTALACCAHHCLTGRNIADPLGSMTRFLPSSSRSSFSVSVFVVLLALAAIVVGITLMYRGQVGFIPPIECRDRGGLCSGPHHRVIRGTLVRVQSRPSSSVSTAAGFWLSILRTNGIIAT